MVSRVRRVGRCVPCVGSIKGRLGPQSRSCDVEEEDRARSFSAATPHERAASSNRCMLRKAARVTPSSNTLAAALSSLLPTASACIHSFVPPQLQPRAAPSAPPPTATMQALSLAQPLVGVARGAAMGGGRFSQRALSARAAVAPRGPVSLLSNHTAAGVLSLQRVSQVTLRPLRRIRLHMPPRPPHQPFRSIRTPIAPPVHPHPNHVRIYSVRPLAASGRSYTSAPDDVAFFAPPEAWVTQIQCDAGALADTTGTVPSPRQRLGASPAQRKYERRSSVRPPGCMGDPRGWFACLVLGGAVPSVPARDQRASMAARPVH